jgi:hypothetical protein
VLDHGAEYGVGVAAVAVARAGCEAKRTLGDQLDERVVREQVRVHQGDDRRHVGWIVSEADVLLQPRRVVEELVDRDPIAGLLRVEGNVLGDMPVEADLPFLDELHDRDGGHRLRHRGDIEARVGGVRRVPLEVRLTEGALVDDAAALDYECGAVELAVAGGALQKGVDPPNGRRRGVGGLPPGRSW